MRMFWLIRETDVTGVSGTGTVAEGVEYTDGTVALRWLKAGTARPDHVRPTTVLHDDLDSVIGLHSHDGKTRVVFEDPTEPEPEVVSLTQTIHTMIAALDTVLHGTTYSRNQSPQSVWENLLTEVEKIRSANR